MKLIEGLKGDMRKSIKEMEKMQDINKSFKEILQYLKHEIETIEKAQSEGMLEIENLDKQSGSTEASITNRFQEM